MSYEGGSLLDDLDDLDFGARARLYESGDEHDVGDHVLPEHPRRASRASIAERRRRRSSLVDEVEEEQQEQDNGRDSRRQRRHRSSSSSASHEPDDGDDDYNNIDDDDDDVFAQREPPRRRNGRRRSRRRADPDSRSYVQRMLAGDFEEMSDSISEGSFVPPLIVHHRSRRANNRGDSASHTSGAHQSSVAISSLGHSTSSEGETQSEGRVRVIERTVDASPQKQNKHAITHFSHIADEAAHLHRELLRQNNAPTKLIESLDVNDSHNRSVETTSEFYFEDNNASRSNTNTDDQENTEGETTHSSLGGNDKKSQPLRRIETEPILRGASLSNIFDFTARQVLGKGENQTRNSHYQNILNQYSSARFNNQEDKDTDDTDHTPGQVTSPSDHDDEKSFGGRIWNSLNKAIQQSQHPEITEFIRNNPDFEDLTTSDIHQPSPSDDDTNTTKKTGTRSASISSPGVYEIPAPRIQREPRSALRNPLRTPMEGRYASERSRSNPLIAAAVVNNGSGHSPMSRFEDDLWGSSTLDKSKCGTCKNGLRSPTFLLLMNLCTLAGLIVVAVFAFWPSSNNSTGGHPTRENNSDAPASPSPSRFEVIRGIVANATHLDVSSPQYRALDWLAFKDRAEVPLFHHETLVQRYVLALVFYSLDMYGFEEQDLQECTWDDTVEVEGTPDAEEMILPEDARSSITADDDFPRMGDSLIQIKCDEVGRVIGVTIDYDCVPFRSPPTELGMLPLLSHLGVRRLHCSPHQLMKEIPPSIGNLTNLTQLDLSGGHFTGPFPSTFQGLTSLTLLDLSDCEFEGSFPSFEGFFKNLTHLYLTGAGVDGDFPASIGRLQQLSNLDVSKIKFRGNISSEFGELTRLSHLDFEWISFDHRPFPSSMGLLTGLTHLSMRGVSFGNSFPTSIGKLTGLTSLELSQIYLEVELPPFLEQLSRLRILDLQGSNLGGSMPSFIWKLHELRYLDLSSCSFTGTIPMEIANLTNLTYWDAKENSLEGAVPSVIGEWSQLRHLDLSFNLFHGKFPSELGKLTELVRMNLRGNAFNGTLLGNLRGLKRLEYLSVAQNNFTGIIPTEIGRCTSLNTLHLFGNMFNGTIPTEIGLLNQLNGIDFSRNKFSGSLPPHIGQLRLMNKINLSDNGLHGSIPAQIGGLTSLVSLEMGSNFFNGTLPVEYGLLTDLLVLDLRNNRLSGQLPAPIGRLASVRELFLSSNLLGGTIPTDLGFLAHVNLLDLSDNFIGGTIPTEIGLMTRLTYMRLQLNLLTGDVPVEIQSMPRLRSINLAGNQLSGTVHSTFCGRRGFEVTCR